MEKVKLRSDQEMKWKTLSSEQVVNRPWLKARRDTVQLPDGRIYDEYYVLSYPGWVNVIAETEDGNIILEKDLSSVYPKRYGYINNEGELCYE